MNEAVNPAAIKFTVGKPVGVILLSFISCRSAVRGRLEAIKPMNCLFSGY
jgi:hypothetical protein